MAHRQHLRLIALVHLSHATLLWAHIGTSRPLLDTSGLHAPKIRSLIGDAGAARVRTSAHVSVSTRGRSLAAGEWSAAYDQPEDDSDGVYNGVVDPFSFEADLHRGRAGPWSQEWDNSIAICATMKGENITDIVEWLDHHRWMKVDRILLTENEDPPQHREALQLYIESDFVEYSVSGTPHAQPQVYSRCLEEHGDKYNWMAFIDLDEFLILREPDQTLKGLLDEYKLFPGLVVHWILFGSSGRETRPGNGGVLKAYTYCRPKPKVMTKTIANMFYVHSVSPTVHGMFYRGHGHPVNEGRYPVKHTIGPPRTGCGHKITDECPLTPSMSCSPAKADRIALFHYAVKSWQDFANKQARGGGIRAVPRPDRFFGRIDGEANRTGGICEEGVRAADMRLMQAEGERRF